MKILYQGVGMGRSMKVFTTTVLIYSIKRYLKIYMEKLHIDRRRCNEIKISKVKKF